MKLTKKTKINSTSKHISEVMSAGGYYFPDYPRDIVEEYVHLMNDGLILDSGAGFGNNTQILLDKTQAKIVATETLDEALDGLGEMRVKYPSRLEVRKEAVELLDETETYDAVVCTMVLHFLPDDLRREALGRIQRSTKVGGINIISAYIFEEGLLEYENFKSGFAVSELKSLYSGWEIIDYREVMPTNPMVGIKHFKSAKIVAKKKTIDS